MSTFNRKQALVAGAAALTGLAGLRLGPASAATHAPGPAGTLHYYDWAEYVSPRTVAAFTKATGITIEMSYFASNEALIARLRAGARGYDLAAPSGYAIAQLAAEGLLEKIDWKRLPTVKKNIDPKFRGLPHDPDDVWSVPKAWGTTGFVYRTDKIKERPKSWQQFFDLIERYPKKFTLLDGSAEVIGSIAVMLGYSFNTDDERELARVERFLLDLEPLVHSFDSRGYADKIIRGTAYGGLAWNGDGAYVIARSPRNAAEYVVATEGGEFWVDSHVIPRGARNSGAAYTWIDFVYRPRIGAAETMYTYFGSPLRRSLLRAHLLPPVMKDPDLFPAPHTFARLEPSSLSREAVTARERIWRRVRAARPT